MFIIQKGNNLTMLNITKKIPGESAKDYVVRQLTNNIIHINLAPGQKLDATELCSELNVSKNPLREAELELSQSRLVEIRPKVGVFVSLIDTSLVEQIRELRSILEAEVAICACDTLNAEQINQLWENVALWQMYIKRNDEEKIFLYDKQFHESIYRMCGKDFWYDLIGKTTPHFDRTTILSFRCNDSDRILKDHEELLTAIEHHDKQTAGDISRRHLTRYSENIAAIKAAYPQYFK